MKKVKTVANSALAALVGLSLVGLGASAQAAAHKNGKMAGKMGMEKCYGVAKAGKNDCQTATSSCAGTAKRDNQKDAWVFVPKGTCDRLGGTTKPNGMHMNGKNGMHMNGNNGMHMNGKNGKMMDKRSGKK